ncbi:MAG: hypothetical protein ACTSQJ_03410, partial [Promethearchaeota archaeon]
MRLELNDLNDGSVFIGDKLGIRSRFIFEEDMSILWAGVRLLTIPPCKKQELQISKEEIFTIGEFEAGEYIRDKYLLIKNNVVPTIEKRNLKYFLELIFRTKNPINPEDDLTIKKKQEIKIKTKENGTRILQLNPISISISGLNINLNKDVFKPGEAIKINYSSKNLREIEVRLMQKANLICYCQPYGSNCRNIVQLPPAIAGDAKTINTEKGFLLLKIPELAEPTHNFLYQASEKDQWGMKFGDYSEWFLLIIGKRKPEFGRDPISFEIPITIVAKSPNLDYKKDIDLFSKESKGGMNIFESISSKFQKRFQLISIDTEDDKEANSKIYKIKIKNISNDNLKGITIKLSGLQEGLFET